MAWKADMTNLEIPAASLFHCVQKTGG
jgi:hypothetical protein